MLSKSKPSALHDVGDPAEGIAAARFNPKRLIPESFAQLTWAASSLDDLKHEYRATIDRIAPRESKNTPRNFSRLTLASIRELETCKIATENFYSAKVGSGAPDSEVRHLRSYIARINQALHSARPFNHDTIEVRYDLAMDEVAPHRIILPDGTLGGRDLSKINTVSSKDLENARRVIFEALALADNDLPHSLAPESLTDRLNKISVALWQRHHPHVTSPETVKISQDDEARALLERLSHQQPALTEGPREVKRLGGNLVTQSVNALHHSLGPVCEIKVGRAFSCSISVLAPGSLEPAQFEIREFSGNTPFVISPMGSAEQYKGLRLGVPVCVGSERSLLTASRMERYFEELDFNFPDKAFFVTLTDIAPQPGAGTFRISALSGVDLKVHKRVRGDVPLGQSRIEEAITYNLIQLDHIFAASHPFEHKTSVGNMSLLLGITGKIIQCFDTHDRVPRNPAFAVDLAVHDDGTLDITRIQDVDGIFQIGSGTIESHNLPESLRMVLKETMSRYNAQISMHSLAE